MTAQTEVNALLETNLTVRTAETVTLSNQLTNLTVTLAKTEAEAKAAAKAAEEELARRDSKIKDLENQNDGLSKTMEDLKGSITTLETRIADTQKKLATSQGEKEFLVKELKRLQAEKAELERQFNDLSAVREQVRKLRDELSIARRLDWIRRGLYGNDVKGGQRLQQGFSKPAGTNDTNAYNLNVEIKREGGAKVVPPAAPATPEKK